jgi:cell wall-associated NlpC family hydrolase
VTSPPPLDPRLNAFRPDLADARLQGAVEAARFVDGSPRRAIAASAPMKRKPLAEAPLESEILRGEVFTVFEDTDEGWSWGQLATDDYVGYVPTDALGPLAPEPTHRIAALRSFVYPGPDLKLPAIVGLPFGARVALAGSAETRGTQYRLLAGGEGAIVAVHALPLEAPVESDFVAAAERFLNCAYLWGGRTSLGLDCSGLVQVSLLATGRIAPRDTDLQEKTLGESVPTTNPRRRGDLAFWPGHVGIMIDAEYLLHASGSQMAVVIEPLKDASARMGAPRTIRHVE